MGSNTCSSGRCRRGRQRDRQPAAPQLVLGDEVHAALVVQVLGDVRGHVAPRAAGQVAAASERAAVGGSNDCMINCDGCTACPVVLETNYRCLDPH